ncbi:hypothetical protein U472_11585 [Orenia metallireducens]|uniref:Uncharacterized protein n=1 Tax=Orenia metallireducens TaxID=1413210 RepID=A0A1C0A8Q3_9FIRM|nr:hypothetical protein [Orenia metallireducens]OCL26617.1 hypothetical protein U472_11585 [Orenia metallireducens]
MRINLFIESIFNRIILNIIFFPYFWAEVRKNLLESNISSIVWNTLLSYTNFIEVADKVSEKTGKTERASYFFNSRCILFS